MITFVYFEFIIIIFQHLIKIMLKKRKVVMIKKNYLFANISSHILFLSYSLKCVCFFEFTSAETTKINSLKQQDVLIMEFFINPYIK